MSLLPIFLLIFVVIVLVGQFSRPANRKIRSHRRIRGKRRTARTGQNSTPSITPANDWWLHSNPHITPSHTDNIVPDGTSGNYAHDLTATGVESSGNTGGADFSGGSDFGGFSGGGGDAGGGGAGADW